ncbi:UDP-glucose 4-epimerase family protein [Stutzerimonas stutzeri]|uniref:UDP-glucose 4-epimerase family protein n=1 Tax=Stutzerimonas stutzeri TaxID=316 RepID=UPI0009BAC98F|nr:SDR family oxidoreductase [Stutzerimonas stutzeri]MDH0182326.1 SDR family oxidoreductase [Stutzerimonas stutzeri]MDH1246942.1 SDR family oxidoreductase [Stutzerimonas stutzeri]
MAYGCELHSTEAAILASHHRALKHRIEAFLKRYILVTGGTGFIGGALLQRLVKRPDSRVLAWVRRSAAVLPVGVIPVFPSYKRVFPVGSLAGSVDTVVHCAARVHVMNETAKDPLAEFRKVNVGLTLDLAKAAIVAGARRFIYLSTVKVHGESSRVGAPFTAYDVPCPADPYAQSKLEAEQQLRKLADETGLELVVIRVPLVYGPGVKGNFRSMMRWLAAGIPLPLGGLDNRRSLVSVDNLVDLIDVCIDHPAAANRTLLVSDGEDVSTCSLLRRMAAAQGRRARLIAVPERWIAKAAKLLRCEGVYLRLAGNLQVDASETFQLLGWRPPVGIDEALRRTAEHCSGESHT